MIRLTRPWLGPEEEGAVANVLRSGMLVQGARVAEFERMVATHTGRTHAVAVTNGTSALMLALEALGIAPGARVLVPNLTWPSPAHAVIDIGAIPVLVDVDLREWNAGPEEMAAALITHGPIAAAIVIDQFGNPARVVEITAALERAAGKPVPVIVDAACSLGSTYNDAPCGSYGVIATTSFHPRKVITTGEGGMCLTDDDTLVERLRELRNHGQGAPGGVVTPGKFPRASGNHRMSEIGAALGVEQMKRLDAIVRARRELTERYQQALEPLGLMLQQEPPGAATNRQTLGVLLPEPCTAAQRDAFIAALEPLGVQAGALTYALNALPHLAALPSAQATLFPCSESIVRRGLALPLYPGMTEAEQATVVAGVKAALRVSTPPDPFQT
jgi:perosamine synthetase